MSESKELLQLARLARRSIEPGLPTGPSGAAVSAGACLYACLLVVMLVRRFGSASAVVRGGGDGLGARDTGGRWQGHYWVEMSMPSGAVFVVDVTADQFGHDPVVVIPLDAAGERYRPGPQPEVDEAFDDLVNDLACRDLVAA